MISKYIVFDLPSGAGGLAPAMYNGQILNQIKKFSDEYNVKFKFRTQGYELKIWFEREEDYTLFFLVYDPVKEWRRPKIRNGKYEENNGK